MVFLGLPHLIGCYKNDFPLGCILTDAVVGQTSQLCKAYIIKGGSFSKFPKKGRSSDLGVSKIGRIL